MPNNIRGLIFLLARVTIEFKTAFLVSSGAGDDVRDAICVADANDLPTIPGSTIAGVLRQSFDESDAQDLFGYQDKDDGQSSRVEVSWAQVHDQTNQPVPFRGPANGAMESDPVLQLLRAGVRRDHVRMNSRGVAAANGKFDERVVPAGARFTFELVLHGEAAAKSNEILWHLQSGSLRFGGRSRRGLGVFEVIDIRGASFDLRRPEDRTHFRKTPRDLSKPLPEDVLMERGTGATGTAEDRWIKATINLTPEDFWLFGGGDPVKSLGHFRDDQPYDMLPVTEARIVWSSGKGSVREAQHPIPASGVKGAMRHRLAYHGSRLEGRFAEAGAEPSTWQEASTLDKLDKWEGVEWWFGAENRKSTDEDSGIAGRVFISDGWINDPLGGALNHVSLDRFTQGPRDGALFDERPLYEGTIILEMWIDTLFGGAKPPRHAKAALAKTLRDLCKGRLAIGAGSSRGHGFCRGNVTWSDGEKWIQEVTHV